MPSSFLLGLLLAAGLGGMHDLRAAETRAAATTAEPEAIRPTGQQDADLALMRPWHLAKGRVLDEHLQALAARGDPRSLLAAALLWPSVEGWRQIHGPTLAGGSGPDGAWLRAAAAARPRDPRVAWLEVSGCRPGWECDPAAARAFLLESAPDDMSVQLMALADAYHRGDEAAAANHLHAAARAPRRSLPVVDMGRLLLESIAPVEAPPMSPAVAAAAGRLLQLNRPATAGEAFGLDTLAVWAALPMPAYQPLGRLCDATTALPEGRREDCLQVMARLADSPVMIDALIGTVRGVRLAGDGEAAPAWRERLRQLYWVYENSTRLVSGQAGAPLPADYIERLLGEGDRIALEQVLAANALPLQAPAGWLPTDARMRGLVQDGREPAPAVSMSPSAR
ncbi:hypothetical protein [Pseudoxanthomonas sp. 10H]|uniref:hypothetical protein n=1 Tax=Pseudoxanthomonas sp. 10H TaxID=3242729 RepID=UPI003558608B